MAQYLIVLADGKFWRADASPTEDPGTASWYAGRVNAEHRLKEFVAAKVAVMGPDPVIEIAVARRLALVVAEAKKDPYTVAAVEKARASEGMFADARRQLNEASAIIRDAQAAAHRLRIENDDLRRKLARLGGV